MSQVQGREIPPDEVRTALTTDERAELERLRQENSALRTQPRPPRRRIRWRSVIAVVLLVLGCALAPVALVAVWTAQRGLRHRPVRRDRRTAGR